MIEQAELQNIRLERKRKIADQQKKFRNLQSDRKYYAQQAVTFIKKQKGNIEKLKNQNQDLQELIGKISTQKTHQILLNTTNIPSENNVQELKELIEKQKQMQRITDVHITNFQKKIVQKKSTIGGYKVGTDSQSTLQKQIKILENRLDKANQKYNQSIAMNRQLRLVIDSLRRERVIFDSLYKKMQKELHQKRKQMANIIEKANNAYQQRDKANGQIQSLKQHAKKEAVDFQRELKELSHVIEKAKIASYIKHGQKITNDFLHNQKARKSNKTTKQKISQNQLQKIQKYRQDFAKIQSATQIQNFEELIRIFSENQQKNFQMFKFVNLQSNEIQQFEQQINLLKQELNKYQTGSQEMYKVQQAKQLQIKYNSAEEKLAELDRRYNKSYKMLNSVTNYVQTLFTTIQCEKQVAKQIAGSKTVSQTNIIIFLGIIQQKVIKIARAYKEMNTREQTSHIKAEKTVQKSKKANDIFTFDQLDEDEQEYDKILTHDDFLRKANETIMKQKNNRQKKKQVLKKKK